MGSPTHPAPELACVYGHSPAEHASPDSGDSRCLVVDEAERLDYVFDDGRGYTGIEHRYCACLRFTPQTGEHGRM
ncbi:MAG: hypothetical protein ACLP50_04600 [Solirubrobacteraceae bacterium]